MPFKSVRNVYVTLAAGCILATTSASFAHSVSTPPSFVNGVGQPVAAQADFTFKPGAIIVSVQNTTEAPRHFTQTLNGLKFKIKNYRGDPYLQTSRGNVRMILTNGTPGAPAAEITNWTFEFKDGEFSLAAPGKNYTVLPETGPNDYYNADPSLLASAQRPFITGSVSFMIIIPGMPTDEQIEGVEFSFSDKGEEIGLIDGINAQPTIEFPDLGGGTPALAGSTTPGGSTWVPPSLPPQNDNPDKPSGPPGGPPDGPNNPNNPDNPPPIVVVPEIGTLALIGATGLLLMRRRKH